jgi:hypothetical protein
MPVNGRPSPCALTATRALLPGMHGNSGEIVSRQRVDYQSLGTAAEPSGAAHPDAVPEGDVAAEPAAEADDAQARRGELASE